MLQSLIQFQKLMRACLTSSKPPSTLKQVDTPMPLAIFYGRVSTREQGMSGLGLAAQRKQVGDWMKANGYTLFLSFEEVATGKDNDRPELLRAIAKSQELKIPIIVSKLDRLSRRVSFISSLMEQPGVQFIAADLGRQVDDLVLHIFASFSESERKRISDRTKAALQAKKAQGFKLGNPNIEEARKKANVVRAKKADDRAHNATVELLEMMMDHHKNVRVRCGLKPIFKNGEYIDGFGWMCPDGTFTKKDAILKMTTKTARKGKWSVVGLNRAIARTAQNLEKWNEGMGIDLLCLTMSNAAGRSMSHTFASHNLQKLEYDGTLISTLQDLIFNIKTIDNNAPTVEMSEETDDEYTYLTIDGVKSPQLRVIKRK